MFAGRIKAVQLDYSDAHKNLLQVRRCSHVCVYVCVCVFYTLNILIVKCIDHSLLIHLLPSHLHHLSHHHYKYHLSHLRHHH